MSNSMGMFLLPTDQIADPQVRAFLDRLSDVWYELIEGDEGAVMTGNLRRLVTDIVGDILSPGVIGGSDGGTGVPAPPDSGGPGGVPIQDALDVLAQSIKRSVLYRTLYDEFVLPDIETMRLDVDGVRQYAGAGISNERTVRNTQDMSLASAINRIWGYIGGSTAVIQDGALAAATPSTATATKWNSVVAAVTDPDTGNVNSASIVQELNAYADDANSTFNAIYTVRAVVATGGETLAGGFGLAATAGAGSSEGPTIDFGVRADKFWIGGTSATPNLTTQLGAAYDEFPFIVVTSTQTIDSITYNPGVYMKTAYIVDASVGTLKIAGSAITVPVFGQTAADTELTTTDDTTIVSATLSTGSTAPGAVLINAGLAFQPDSSSTTEVEVVNLVLFRESTELVRTSVSVPGDRYTIVPYAWTDTAALSANTSYNYHLKAKRTTGASPYSTISGAFIQLLGAKR